MLMSFNSPSSHRMPRWPGKHWHLPVWNDDVKSCIESLSVFHNLFFLLFRWTKKKEKKVNSLPFDTKPCCLCDIIDIDAFDQSDIVSLNWFDCRRFPSNRHGNDTFSDANCRYRKYIVNTNIRNDFQSDCADIDLKRNFIVRDEEKERNLINALGWISDCWA